MIRNCVRGLRAATSFAKSTAQPRFVAAYSTKDNDLASILKDLLTNPKHEDGKSTELAQLYDYVQQNKDAMKDITEVIAQVGAELQYNGYKIGNLYKKDPVVISVTGAAGQIGYSLLPRIASGELLGEDQPVILKLIERPEALKALQGVVMELQDCAFPLLRGIVATADLDEGFSGSDYAFLVGGKPRGPGMERGDLLKDNGALFAAQGKSLNANAKSNVLVLVVGNPANTNALVASANAPKINPANFSAMTRLDQDRAIAQVALKAKVPVKSIERVNIWGNHSATQYPDINFATIDGKPAKQIINDEQWIKNTFIPTVQKRGAAIIAARGLSSAASAADAAIKHMRDWARGSSDWVSMAVPSNGSYGIAPGIFCSYPIVCSGNGAYEIVKDLPLDDFSKTKIRESVKELEEEKAAVKALLK